MKWVYLLVVVVVVLLEDYKIPIDHFLISVKTYIPCTQITKVGCCCCCCWYSSVVAAMLVTMVYYKTVVVIVLSAVFFFFLLLLFYSFSCFRRRRWWKVVTFSKPETVKQRLMLAPFHRTLNINRLALMISNPMTPSGSEKQIWKHN